MFLISVLRSKDQRRNWFQQGNESITFNEGEADRLVKTGVRIVRIREDNHLMFKVSH